jgi:hypothetical protein
MLKKYMVPKAGPGCLTPFEKAFFLGVTMFGVASQFVLADTANLYKFLSVMTIGA